VEPSTLDGLTPARAVRDGKATFAIAPSESAISFATTDCSETSKLKAIAAVLQGSTSSICTLKSSGIDRPQKLMGKRYASYGGRFEDAIVASMVNADGGDGSKVLFHNLDHHGYGDADTMKSSSIVASYLEKGGSDSTWIFTHWEGVLAKRAGQQLNCFALEDYKVPYGYAPILLAHPNTINDKKDAVQSFIQASARGYAFAAEKPAEAAQILMETAQHPSLNDLDFLVESQTLISKEYLLENKWGVMDLKRWSTFVEFLSTHNILTDRQGNKNDASTVDVASLFTNEFVKPTGNN
jgi:NitT/TauT family transport system substrate-binding protein